MQAKVTFSREKQEFFSLVRQRVNQYFKENKLSKSGGFAMYLKTTFMFGLYFLPFTLVFLQIFPSALNFLWYILMGLGVSGIGLAVMHDANHGAYDSQKWVNNLMSYSMNVIGYCSFNWKVQHNLMHHTYTNIYTLDEDIADKPFLKLSPYGYTKPYHRFQHLYAPLLYSFATLNWFLIKDLQQFLTYSKGEMIQRLNTNITKETIIFILTKVFYVGYIFVLPLALGVHWTWVIGGFLIMQMVIGLSITLVFQLAHVVEGLEHYIPVQQGTMENTWAVHQLHSTANFDTNNKLLTWCIGGLNFQVEHHLFPDICHVHYPEISKIVKLTAEELDLPYHENSTFGVALASHFKTLKKIGSYVPENQKVSA